MAFKTPWFSEDTTPARVGYYDTRWPTTAPMGYVKTRNALGGVRFVEAPVTIRLYWNGRVWLASKRSKSYTANLFRQRRQWRGLFSHAKRR